jgi:hypothetical protein
MLSTRMKIRNIEPVTTTTTTTTAAPVSVSVIEVGGVATSDSSYYSTSWLAKDAFDSNTARPSAWNSAASAFPHWLCYAFISGPKVVTSYKLNVGDHGPFGPKDWQFQGWTGTDWVVLDAQSSVTWPASDFYTYKTFNIVNTTPYYKYRLYVTKGNAAAELLIHELKLFGY